MNTSVNSDLARERQNASFNPEVITNFLDGGRERTARRRYIENQVLNDPIYSVNTKVPYLSDVEGYDHAVRMACVSELKVRQLGLRPTIRNAADLSKSSADVGTYSYLAIGNEVQPFGLHYGMFVPTILGQGTQEQMDKWLPLCNAFKVIGTYAQTEIGHGTYIRGLETTATYEPSTREFVLNTPTVTATKFWPGSMGKTVNHVVLMAQLYSQGKCHGVHAFVVQLRSFEDHSSLPGITVGTIGPKFGYRHLDNGFLKFDNVRIPRENMLMKFAQVSPEDGAYTRVAVPQLTYMSMVFVRSRMVLMIGQYLAKAATIAIRYSAVRRQTAGADGIEPQIIDYQTQQLKLFPHLACAYAFHSAGKRLIEIYIGIMDSLLEGDISRLDELHCLTACLKAMTADVASVGIEVLRVACGGHGYSAASGFYSLYERCVPAITYEGENTVMYLQTARSLVKYFNKAKRNGTQPPPSCAYLAQQPSLARYQTHVMTSDDLVYVMQARAYCLVASAVGKITEHVAHGLSAEQAWNATSVHLVKAAESHAEQFVAGCFMASVLSDSAAMDEGGKLALSRLVELHLVSSVLRHSGDFLQDSLLSSSQMRALESRQLALLTLVRPDAVALVDAFDFPDALLASALGRYDGNVYEALYKFAEEAPLNKSDVHSSYFKYIQPLQNALSKL